MRKTRLLHHVLVYVMWVVVLALGLWVLLLSRDVVVAVASALFVEESSARFWRITSVERFYILGAGLAWLALMILSEFYFRNGVRQGRLFVRFARVLGIELVILFVVDGVLYIAQGLPAEAWVRWLILGAELALGVASLVFARSSSSLISDITSGDQD